MDTAPAPVAFFAFNRPAHATRCLRALAGNLLARSTHVVCHVDGPRNPGEQALTDEVVRSLREVDGFASVDIVQSKANQGLYRALTGGIGAALDTSESVIVVEDDIETSPYFLSYMNDGLERFRGDGRVGSIHGFAPPITGLPEYFFLPGADCWGWATWRDRWTLFRPDAAAVLRELHARGLTEAFCESHGFESLGQLARRAAGKSESWAILWHASLFLEGRLTLHPGRSFVQNIGNDGSGVHSRDTSAYSLAMRNDYSGIPPIEVRADTAAARALSRFMDSGHYGGPLAYLHRLALSASAKRAAARILRAGS